MTDERRRIVREGYESIAEEYADQRSQDPAEVAVLEELLDRLSTDRQVGGRDLRALDAGCGDGTAVLAPLLEAGVEAVGLDVAAAQLRAARGTASAAALTQGDLASLPFAEDSFDAVCSFHAIIHVPRDDHGAVIGEFRRVLRDDGYLLFSTGVEPWEGSNPDWLDAGAAMAWSFYGRERTRELLADAGFAVVDEWVIGDELGGGTWLFVLARAEE